MKIRRRGRVMTWIGLGLWAVATTLVSSSLLARHVVPLPRPEEAALTKALSTLRGPAELGKLLVVHVLYADCPCSARVADHLVATRRPPGLAEHVLLAGHDPAMETRLESHGFVVRVVDPDELSSVWHIEAAPLFAVLGAEGDVLYSGGYTTSKQGPAPQDLDLIARATSGLRVAALPVFGCAVSRALRSQLNPLGIP